MDQESLKALDDASDLDVIEVHYLTTAGDERTAVGGYNGLKKSAIGWCLRLTQKPMIPMIDVLQIRILTTTNQT